MYEDQYWPLKNGIEPNDVEEGMEADPLYQEVFRNRFVLETAKRYPSSLLHGASTNSFSSSYLSPVDEEDDSDEWTTCSESSSEKGNYENEEKLGKDTT
jgi:hypothetical protein